MRRFWIKRIWRTPCALYAQGCGGRARTLSARCWAQQRSRHDDPSGAAFGAATAIDLTVAETDAVQVAKRSR